MELYLAGPMRGYKNANAEAFKEAREALRDMGHNVFCPSELTKSLREAGRNPDLKTLLSHDLSFICSQAEGVVCLPGWGTSKGALAEVHTAWAIEIPVYEYELFVRRIIREVKNVTDFSASKAARSPSG